MTIESIKDGKAQKSAATPKLESIQALRGVAVLFVLLAHIYAFDKEYGGAHLVHHLTFGNMGVDLFFCISGYIMVTITGGHTPRSGNQIKTFLKKRVVRIYPLYWIVSIATLVAWTYLPPPQYVYQAKDNVLQYYVESLLLVPIATGPIVNQGWSLTNEMYFYIVFGCLLLVPQRALWKWLLGWSCITVAARAFAFIDPDLSNGWFLLVANRMSLEFIAGCLVALLIHRQRKGLALPILAAGIVWTCITIASDPVQGHFIRLAWFGAPSILILTGCVLGETYDKWKFPRWLIGLGNISYSLYLTHVLSFTVVGIVWSKAVSGADVWFSLALSATMALASICLAVLTYRYLEKPLLGWCHRLWFIEPSEKRTKRVAR